MPIEIREIVIKTQLESAAKLESTALERAQIEQLRQDILAQCECLIRDQHIRQQLER